MKTAFRRFLETTLLALCFLLVFRAVGVEPYGVPTGSMAPTLLGYHKALVCALRHHRLCRHCQRGEPRA